MKFSSSFKVGILAISAIIILLFTVMWVKGKAISNAERITITFNDVNGMRAGSGVQMMGVRIGQVEEIEPIITEDKHNVDVKFVITEPNVVIPKASEISIQQSGIIGEQFLEITPPKEKVIYIPEQEKSFVLHSDDKVQMKLDDKFYDIGIVKKIEIVEKNSIPALIKDNIPTKNAYKVKYVLDLPGLILPEQLSGKIVKENNDKKLRLTPKEDIEMTYPKTDSPYTVIEPMRIADFLALQYRSAESLVETNERISMILSDDVIAELKQTSYNLNELTDKANVTMAKAQELIDLSKSEIEMLSDNINELAVNVNKIAGDEDFVKSISNATKSVERLSNNVSSILEDDKTKTTLANLDITAKNVAELSSYINDMSKDAQLKKAVKESVVKINTALDKLSVTLDTVNYATEDEEQLKQTLDDISVTSENLKKFSTKLNKRFLLFRLMF
jgi:phospholipid/cholesterol/gamma-HCH transport system substrate-binding protein